jgi:hypothetical protein
MYYSGETPDHDFKGQIKPRYLDVCLVAFGLGLTRL